MIFMWIEEAWQAFLQWLAGILSAVTPDVPSFLADLPGYISQAQSFMAGTSVWFPWSLFVSVVTAYALCFTAAVTIKLVRIVASFFTAGGGSAA